ncbi:hypothetical protein AB0B89_09490 [Sphaerisporangium sp. NPDC049002]|uniref:hypothetical protein n=1 Tax=unclassified Sphaerisporangium TaxID=2630420 RepID=UPI003411B523
MAASDALCGKGACDVVGSAVQIGVGESAGTRHDGDAVRSTTTLVRYRLVDATWQAEVVGRRCGLPLPRRPQFDACRINGHFVLFPTKIT